jgi:hypothetical protein
MKGVEARNRTPVLLLADDPFRMLEKATISPDEAKLTANYGIVGTDIKLLTGRVVEVDNRLTRLEERLSK